VARRGIKRKIPLNTETSSAHEAKLVQRTILNSATLGFFKTIIQV
jgi:hypothetical protein